MGAVKRRSARKHGFPIEQRITFTLPGSKEPLNKPRVAATEAFRDEMPHLPTEATRCPWQAPRASGATADRPLSWQLSPVPSGFGAMALICVVARLANRHPLFAAPSVGK